MEGWIVSSLVLAACFLNKQSHTLEPHTDKHTIDADTAAHWRCTQEV
jgi:hypothetical protein